MSTRLLVINNSDHILTLFHKILSSENCEIFTRLFLHVDLKGVQNIKSDLIILDDYVGLEEIGWAFLKILRSEETTGPTPVLICTIAVRLAHEIAGYLATKQMMILRKPFARHNLLVTVQMLLQEHGAEARTAHTIELARVASH